jgi:hypothetical protein
MMDERLRQLVAGYVDGELSGDELAAFKQELSTNAELRAEVEEFKRIKEVTGAMTYADLPDEVWDTYWSSLYRKTERGLGWILFSTSVIVLLAFGTWQAFSGLWANPDTPLWLKLGASGGALGVIILLVSYGRERLFAYKRERYSEVEK